MQKIQLSKFINAPKEKVWHTMLDKETYSEWTKAFNPTSRYEGEFTQGSKLLFVGTEDDGKEMGMVSRVAELRPYEYVSIEHLGIYANGVEDTESEAAKKWAPAFENYTFIEKDGGTEVSVDQDIEDEYKEMFEKMWVSALNNLAELSEK